MEDIGEEEDTTDDKKLYHRQGEAWIMENTWITGEKYPNDPFKTEMTVGQADMIKRVIPGTYILEEVKAPAGYAKGFPEGITVTETREVQKTGMEDEKIKVEIVKTDAPGQYRINVISDSAGHAVSDYDQGSGSQENLSRINSRIVRIVKVTEFVSSHFRKFQNPILPFRS